MKILVVYGGANNGLKNGRGVQSANGDSKVINVNNLSTEI